MKEYSGDISGSRNTSCKHLHNSSERFASTKEVVAKATRALIDAIKHCFQECF
jgi:hypothetical protein